MRLRERATKKTGGKAGVKPMAMASAVQKRPAPAKRSVAKKSVPAKKAAPLKKPPLTAKKPVPAKKPAVVPVKPVPSAEPNPPPARPATPPAAAGPPIKPPVQVVKPVAAPAGTAPGTVPSAEERRRAATRKFFARLRSLEAIVGADLRKRGSLVLMQAVDKWYSEAISATATDISITTAAKAVISQL